MYKPELAKKVYNSKPGITGAGPLLLRDEEKIASDAEDRGEDPKQFYKPNSTGKRLLRRLRGIWELSKQATTYT